MTAADPGTAGAPTVRWTAALDGFEAALDGYLGLSVAAHDPAGEPAPGVPEFVPPAQLGPLPARLRVRAIELTARAALIEAELIRVKDETAGELAHINRPRAVYGHERATGRLDGLA
jgi:hypothetical protein